MVDLGGGRSFLQVRQYLWSQTCISRFNEEGKKAKSVFSVSLYSSLRDPSPGFGLFTSHSPMREPSPLKPHRSKGNHVWHIEAQKLVNGQWNFLHFQRKIVGTPPTEAYVGEKYAWNPKVWDPQCSAHNIRAHFSSPNLPDWLSWNDNCLSGMPTLKHLGQEVNLLAVATTTHNARRYTLDLPVKIVVRPAEDSGPCFFFFFAIFISTHPNQRFFLPRDGQRKEREGTEGTEGTDST